MKLKLITSLMIPLFLISCTPGGNIGLNNGNSGSTNNSGTNNGSPVGANGASVQGTSSTILGGSSGVVANTNFVLKNLSDMSLDGKGNLFVLDSSGIYKVELATGNVKMLKQAGKKADFPVPQSKFGFSSFLIDDKGSNNVTMVFPSDNIRFQKLILSNDSEEVVNQADIVFDNLNLLQFSGIVKNSKGDYFVSDKVGSKIYKISGNKVTIFAGGGGEPGSTTGYRDGNGSAALFFNPDKIALDKSDNIYVADSGNNRIRKIDINGVVSTLAGDGSLGSQDGTKAQFNSPQGVTVDNFGNVYVADTGNHKIRRIDANGNVSTVAGVNNAGFSEGTGSSAVFYEPNSIISDGNNILYISDSKNLRIRKLELK